MNTESHDKAQKQKEKIEQRWKKRYLHDIQCLHQLSPYKPKMYSIEHLHTIVQKELDTRASLFNFKAGIAKPRDMVNYLRHQEDVYYQKIRDYKKRQLTSLYHVHKVYILLTIAEAYPTLKKECLTQIKRMFHEHYQYTFMIEEIQKIVVNRIQSKIIANTPHQP